MTRAFYVKYLRQTLKSLNKEAVRYCDSNDPDFIKQSDYLTAVAEATQSEMDRVLEGPEEGDFSAALAAFNRKVLLPHD